FGLRQHRAAFLVGEPRRTDLVVHLVARDPGLTARAARPFRRRKVLAPLDAADTLRHELGWARGDAADPELDVQPLRVLRERDVPRDPVDLARRHRSPQRERRVDLALPPLTPRP